MTKLEIPQGYTTGEWRWCGSPKTGFYLATVDRGRQYVMGFKRLGFGAAQPTFQIGHRMVDGRELCIFDVARDATSADDPRVYRDDIVGFRAPDAALIALAPQMAERIAELEGAGLEALNVLIACVTPAGGCDDEAAMADAIATLQSTLGEP